MSFIPLPSMKNRQFITSISLALTVLFSILFQSLHSYEHISEQLTAEKCHHDYSDKNGQITHQHTAAENCYICHFSFASYLLPDHNSVEFTTKQTEIPYFYTPVEPVFTFSGNHYFLRGPPAALIG
jgi:hypothetical protein